MAAKTRTPGAGEIGFFRKSGSRVRVIRMCDEPTYEGLLEVERTDTLKRMVIPPDAFVPEDLAAAEGYEV